MPLRIIFMGTPEFAVPCLSELIGAGHEVVCVYTQPPRAAGRGQKEKLSPIHVFAQQAGLPVETPVTLKSADEQTKFAHFNADAAVVAAYGLILPKTILDAPRFGCLNLHASLLPRWRGASPIQQAILAGDELSGVSSMKRDRGLDTGDVILRRSLAIAPTWNSARLHDALAPLGAELLLESLCDIEPALRRAEAQENSAATYAPRLSKQQAEVDWSKPAEVLLREIRAYNPWPVSFSFLGQDSIRLWTARACSVYVAQQPGRVVAHDGEGVYVSCGDAVLQVTELQFAGRNRCSAVQALSSVNLSGCLLGRVDE